MNKAYSTNSVTIDSVGIVPVIKLDDPAQAVPLTRALAAGGVPIAKVTSRSDAAEESICRIAREVPELSADAVERIQAAHWAAAGKTDGK